MKVVFLLGAGFSIPAGLLTIDKLTHSFEEEKLDDNFKEAYVYVKDVLKKKYTKVDIEHVLQQLNEFVIGQRETSYLFYGEQNGLLGKHSDKFLGLIDEIKLHFREKLEVKTNVDYLIGLKGFLEDVKVADIFTLNYDSVIETFCEKENIEYTDGFELTWNPQQFEREYGVNIYKLHGSLYWFKTDRGKLVKIPLKHLQTDKEILYYTGEKISESMIYPATIKELEANPYSFLREKFKDKLSGADLLVVVGYSFRDREILNLLREQTTTNTDLWLLIVDLHPKKVKRRICEDNRTLIDRTVTLEKDARQAFGQRILNRQVLDILRALNEEKNYLARISGIPEYKSVEHELQTIVFRYKDLNHFSRIKSLIEKVFSTDFEDFDGPNYQLANHFFVCAFGFAVESCRSHNWKSAELWLQIFCGLLIHYEHSLIAEFGTEAARRYRQIWEETRRRKIPWGTAGASYTTLDLKKSIDVNPQISEEPKIVEKIESLIDSMKNLIEVVGSPSDARARRMNVYNANVLNGKTGLIYSVPQLLDLISTKFDGKDSFVKKWNPGIVC